jgi:hypothetical protein
MDVQTIINRRYHDLNEQNSLSYNLQKYVAWQLAAGGLAYFQQSLSVRCICDGVVDVKTRIFAAFCA